MGKFLLWSMLILSVLAEDCLAGDDPYVLQLQELAAQGDDESRFALALLYEYGEQGVGRDPEKAVFLFLRAGQAGMPAACLYLGIKYENGSGVVRDPVVASNWYGCAARKGWAMAQFFLAELYKKGKGVGQDNCLALAWYGLAEEQGYPGAKEAVAQLGQEMSGADQDRAASLRPGLLGLATQ
jgi:TPR repeat protein